MRSFTSLTTAALLALLAFAPAALRAQATVFGTGKDQVPAMEIGLGYTYFHANAPPSGCGCFSLNGAGITWVVNSLHGISLVADISGAHASHVDSTTQNITIVDYLGGLRYSWRSHRRSTAYIQALGGGSTENSNYIYVNGASGAAALAGGGINLTLNPHIGINLFEADYVYSAIQNAANNNQNDIRIRTGILFRFGPR